MSHKWLNLISPHQVQIAAPDAGWCGRYAGISFLEEHLQRELNRTRPVVPVAVLRSPDVAEAAGLEVQLLRLREGRRVGDVEGFRAELEAERFRDCEVLEKRGVQVGVMRPRTCWISPPSGE